MGGRSFHLVASSSRDGTVIIWKVVLTDFASGALLQIPKVQPVQVISQEMLAMQEVQRLKWNVLGTCLATTTQ